MKKQSKIILGVGIAAAAIGAFAAGVIHELKTIKKLTTDIDEIPEEEVPTTVEAEETVAEEIAEDAGAEEITEEAAPEAAEEAVAEETAQ